MFVMVVSLLTGVAFAVDYDRVQDQVRDQNQMSDQDQIYGRQLMTQQERTEHRAKMRAAKTDQEREHIRNQHHTMMKKRADERGVTLSAEPPVSGGGMGIKDDTKRLRGGGMGSGGGGRGR